MLHHTYDGLLPSSASRKEHVGKYLALYTLKNKEFYWLSNLHACFASIAKLKALIFWKPIPPFFLGSHNLSQFI